MAMRVEQIGNATLYLGDCLEILPALEKADAVVTDPPYGMSLNADFSKMKNKNKFMGKNGGNKYDPIIGDNTPFDPAPLFSAAGQFVFFGADYYLSRLPPGGSLSVWDKRLTETADKMFGSCFETVWFYPSRRRDIIRYKWAGIFGTEKEDIKKRAHPAQKPARLMQDVILKLKSSPAVILDPYMGSGTTGIACIGLGRRFIGIEINEKYFNTACKRITEAWAARGKQPGLFPDTAESAAGAVE
jgi:site-specific DNA-methyltransferase (adenine-specific)/modification methylase